MSTCNLQQIADFTGIHPTSLVFAGGGSKGKLWSQILADVSGLTVNVPVVKEATALGCAIAAGVGGRDLVIHGRNGRTAGALGA